VRVPAWADALVLDVRVSPRLWPRFTDFALSVWDAAGRLVAQQPLNYAVGRHQVAVDSLDGALLEVELFPAFALPHDTSTWDASVGMSFVAASPLATEPPQTLTADPDRPVAVLLPALSPAVPLPDGFAPLVEATARPDHGAPATRRGPLPGGAHGPGATR
jgi:hypothetical protein